LHVLLALRVLRAPLSLRMFCLRLVARPTKLAQACDSASADKPPLKK
jgi:hypothetical protein